MLLREFVEEQLCHAGDSGVDILQTSSHLADMTLDFHHIVQNQMGQHRDGVLSNACVGVVQRVAPFLDTVQVFSPRLDGVGESERQITKGDKKRGASTLVGLDFETSKDQFEMILAEFGVQNHEARKRGERSAAQKFGPLHHCWVRAKLHDKWSIYGDEPTRSALFRGEKLSFGLFSSGV